MKNNTRRTIDFVLILAVFALSGSSTAVLSGIIMGALGAEPWTWGYAAGYLFFIFPLYQLLTIVYAFLLGKFNFFYSRQKKIAQKIFGLLKKTIRFLSFAEQER